LSLGASRPRAFRVRLPDASLSVQTYELLEGDAERLRRTYRFLWQLHDHARRRQSGADALQGLVALIQRMELDRVYDDVGALGRGLQDEELSSRVRKAYHDVRGGSLLALLMHLDLLLQGLGQAEDVARIAILARDHLKIMRNAVPDLDPGTYAADLQAKAHPVALLREKWSSVRYRFGGREIDVDLDCAFDGTIAACCMEFSTLDRIVYNLVNNAAEHSADARVRMVVLPIADAGSEAMLLRVAVLNRMGAQQRERLEASFGREPSALFQGGFTTDGHGLGLRICADLVAHAAGVPSIELAVDEGHLGIRIVEDWFVAWFVWPSAEPRRAVA
jgi:signal transduction histidine kinase